jgi:uncharacterized phiE125 gp8 family phage protein
MTIALATIKAALKIDYTDDDTELERIRDAAVAWVENYCGFALSSATRTMYLRDWQDTVFAVQPVTALTVISYTNAAGVSSVLAAGTDYYLDISGAVSILRFLDEPPEIKPGTLATVGYTAGYATEPNEVVQAVISLVGLWYNNPEAAQPIGLTAVPLGAQFMLEHLRLKGPFT